MSDWPIKKLLICMQIIHYLLKCIYVLVNFNTFIYILFGPLVLYIIINSKWENILSKNSEKKRNSFKNVKENRDK